MTTQEKQAHTPLPWKYDLEDIRHPCIVGGGKHIAEVGNADMSGDSDAEWEANAELIVTAVNDRASLLSEIARLREALVGVRAWLNEEAADHEELALQARRAGDHLTISQASPIAKVFRRKITEIEAALTSTGDE